MWGFIIYTHTSKTNNRLKQNGLLFPVFSAQRVWRIYCQQTRTLITNILRDSPFKNWFCSDRSGGNLEVMGLLLGKVDANVMVVMDSFALPVEGTETRVNAQAQGWVNQRKVPPLSHRTSVLWIRNDFVAVSGSGSLVLFSWLRIRILIFLI